MLQAPKFYKQLFSLVLIVLLNARLCIIYNSNQQVGSCVDNVYIASTEFASIIIILN